MNFIDKNIYENFIPGVLDISGWNGNSSVFCKLIDSVKPTLIVEVGSWKGMSAINMASYLKKNNINCQILCVDTWLGSEEFWGRLKHTPERDLKLKNGYPQIYYQFLTNIVLSGVKEYILPFPTTSTIAAKYFKNNNIQPELVYIDASHEYEDVLCDIKNYFDLLRRGGIIFGDDYVAWPGVKLAVNKFCEEKQLKFEILENNFWVIVKEDGVVI